MSEEELVEELAALNHDQWNQWSQDIASTGLSPERLRRWESLWCSYEYLSEAMKEKDRELARKVLKIVRKHASG